MTDSLTVTAAILVIGDEILSGRTKDKNIGYIAEYLDHDRHRPARSAHRPRRRGRDRRGRERAARTATTMCSRPAASARPTTTSPPTPSPRPSACRSARTRAPSRMLLERYQARATSMPRAGAWRASRTGADLIENPISKAPGFRIGNVIVMAGVPAIMQAMLDDAAPTAEDRRQDAGRRRRGRRPAGGRLRRRRSREIAEAHPASSIGSYPSFIDGRFRNQIVRALASDEARARRPQAMRCDARRMRRQARRSGAEPQARAFRAMTRADGAVRQPTSLSRSPGTSSIATPARLPGGWPAPARSTAIVAITRGGLVPAAIVARELGIRVIETVCIASYHDYKTQGELSVFKRRSPPRSSRSRRPEGRAGRRRSRRHRQDRARRARDAARRAFRHRLRQAAWAGRWSTPSSPRCRRTPGSISPGTWGSPSSRRCRRRGCEGVRTLPAWAERIQDHRGPGTIIIADLEASSQISEEAVRQYLSPYVQFLPVPVLVNGQNISQKQFENAVEGQASGFVSRPPRNVFRGAFAGELQTLINPQGRVIARLRRLSLNGTDLVGEVFFLQDGGQTQGYRNLFGLAPIPVQATVCLVGSLISTSSTLPQEGKLLAEKASSTSQISSP